MSARGQALQKYAVIGVMVVLFAAFSLLAPSFFGVENLVNLLVQSAILGIVGFGLVVIMMAGEIDLSFAGTIPLAGSLFATLVKGGSPVPAALAAAFALGVLVALVISLLVTRLRLVSFVCTVAMMFLLQGVWQSYTGGNTVWLGEEFDRSLVFGMIGPFPRIVLLFAGVFLAVYLLTEHTPFGVWLRAVGEDMESARTAGIGTARIKTAAFVIGGLIFALGAFLSTARLSGALATSGADMLMPVMTVAFVGQTVLGMGRPNILGVLVAALLLGMINNAFVLMSLPIWSVPMANGVILMSAIAVSNIGKRDIVQIRM